MAVEDSARLDRDGRLDRAKYQKMVNYIRENVGGVLALYTPRPGEIAVNYKGDRVKLIRATDDLDELQLFIDRYVVNYALYSDYPIIELSDDRKLLYIMPSYDATIAGYFTKQFKTEI